MLKYDVIFLTVVVYYLVIIVVFIHIVLSRNEDKHFLLMCVSISASHIYTKEILYFICMLFTFKEFATIYFY